MAAGRIENTEEFFLKFYLSFVPCVFAANLIWKSLT